MTDVYGANSQFILLTNTRRRWFDNRTLFLFVLITIPIVIFSGIYIFILKDNESLLYPKSYIEVPLIISHRAKIYSDSYAKKKKINELLILPKNYENIEDFKLICYYNFPSSSKSLQPKDINPYLCTHINVGFASIINHTVYLSDLQLKVLEKVVDLKTTNQDLKVLISVGGAGNDNGFDLMALNHSNRKKFIKSLVYLIKNFNVDGVDLDWEFPRQQTTNDKHQKIHFLQLLEEIRNVINKQRNKFILSVAVAAPVVIIDDSYDATYLNQFVDFINVMTYDFHFYSKLTPFTGFNAPLYPSVEDNGYFSTLNTNYSVHYWVSKGMDRRKIMVGFPTYGHTFRLTNTQNTGLYAPARGFGKLGSQGFVDYPQVCAFLNLNRISPIFDLESKSPYAAKSSEWVSFDNEQSLSFKAEFVRNCQFGGAMVYSLNSDDYAGSCNIDPRVPNNPFPLISKIKEILSKNYSLY